MVNVNTFNSASTAISAAGQLAGSIIQYQAQKSSLASMERIENWRFKFAQFQLGKEAELMKDVEGIAANKRGVTVELARATKNNAIAKAKYSEMKKTQKSASLNTQAILAKRDRAFYGSPIRAS